MKRIMAVYDVDPFYTDRFAEYVNRRENTVFTAVAFSSLARLKEFALQQNVEILLVGDGVKDEELEGLGAAQVVRLSETGISEGETPAVYKYQASDNVLREVMACYQVQERTVLPAAVGRRSRVIGVYSPVGRCGKTAFSLTLGQVLARQGKTLYLTLEEFSGLSAMTGTKHDGGLSELIYDYRKGQYSALKLGSVVYNWGELDYVPPVDYAEDLVELSGNDLAGLTERIAAEGIYEVIVVDMGHFFWGAEMLLALCDVIYMPVREDSISSEKIEEWRTSLENSGRGRLWQRIRRVKLPRQQLPGSPGVYLEQLLWGEMGDFARSLAGQIRGEDV
ncbi:MAG: hypothetical protein Q4C73_01480 [Eubacteriales bacterium]|nr:hypothetical protein [Eubacteriales bacterium]